MVRKGNFWLYDGLSDSTHLYSSEPRKGVGKGINFSKNLGTGVSGIRTVLFVVMVAVFDSDKNDTILQEKSAGYNHHKTE